MSEDFVKNICKIVGHTSLRMGAHSNMPELVVKVSGWCTRCGEEWYVKVPYSDLQTRKFAVLDRARQRIEDKAKEKR